MIASSCSSSCGCPPISMALIEPTVTRCVQDSSSNRLTCGVGARIPPLRVGEPDLLRSRSRGSDCADEVASPPQVQDQVPRQELDLLRPRACSARRRHGLAVAGGDRRMGAHGRRQAWRPVEVLRPRHRDRADSPSDLQPCPSARSISPRHELPPALHGWRGCESAAPAATRTRPFRELAPQIGSCRSRGPEHGVAHQ